jgi:hypothetical protein
LASDALAYALVIVIIHGIQHLREAIDVLFTGVQLRSTDEEINNKKASYA